MLPSHLKECDLFQLQIKQRLVLPCNVFLCCCRKPKGRAGRTFGQQICHWQHPQEHSLNGSHSSTCVLTGEPVPTSKLRGPEGAGDFLTLRSPHNCSWEDFGLCSAWKPNLFCFPGLAASSKPITKGHCRSCPWHVSHSRLPAASTVIVGRGTSCPLSWEIKADLS